MFTRHQSQKKQQFYLNHLKKVSETQTAQTQTLVPLNAFKFVEKGDQKFLEPVTPIKAEELQMKKKLIKSVVMLDPNRYKRKPYIIHSSFKANTTSKK